MATATLIPLHAGNRRRKGFSLVELMVGIAVGLIVTMVVISTTGTMNLQRRTTVAGNDAKESGQAALNMLERLGKLAGTGFFYNGKLICSRINVYHNNATIHNGSVFMPVKITDGGNTGSDKITFTYGSATGGHSVSHLVDSMPNTSANFTVGNAGGLANGELAVIGVPDSSRPCTLFQVTGFPPGGNCNGITTNCMGIQHNPGVAGPYNPPDPNNVFTDAPRYGYETAGAVIGPAVISRVGTFNNDTYEVLCNALVSHDETAAVSCNASPMSFTNATPWVNNVVMLKAQYGISDSVDSDIVTQWVSASDTAWSNPGAADVPRIRAIRVAVIARSPEPAASSVTAPCTNHAGIVNHHGPCAFQDADTPVIDLSAIPVPSGKSWQHFRYRVYQSVIPLRNVLWNY